MKTVLLQTIQLSISIQFSSIWPTDRTLSGATTLDQSGPGSDGNEGVLRISQSANVTGASPSVIVGFTPLQGCSQGILQPQPTGRLTRVAKHRQWLSFEI